MPSRAYRGPVGRQFVVISNKTVAGAYLPCTFVTEGASTLTQATAAGPNLRLLINRDFYSEGHFNATDPLLTAYASGDTGEAAVLEPGQTWQAAMAAATYTYGQELTVAANGRLAAAASTNIVVGFARGAGAISAGGLLDFEVANFYAKP